MKINFVKVSPCHTFLFVHMVAKIFFAKGILEHFCEIFHRQNKPVYDIQVKNLQKSNDVWEIYLHLFQKFVLL